MGKLVDEVMGIIVSHVNHWESFAKGVRADCGLQNIKLSIRRMDSISLNFAKVTILPGPSTREPVKLAFDSVPNR